MTTTPPRRAARTRAAPLLLTLALAAAACAVKAPPMSHWSIARDSQPDWDPRGPSVGVLDVAAAPEVRSTSLTWRSHDGRHLQRHPHEQWTDYPDRLVEELLVARLAGSGTFSLVREAPPTGGLDALLACRLLDFTEWGGPGGGEARVDLRCVLSDAAGRETPIEASARVPTPSPSAAGMVRALASAAEQAVDAIGAETKRHLEGGD